MKLSQMIAIVDRVEFPGYDFVITPRPDGFTIHARFLSPCNVAGGKPEMQSTRKWFVSQNSCASEVVGTCLKLVLTSLEHEAREQFKYRGVAVYGPHHDLDKLVQFVKTVPPAARPEPAPMLTGGSKTAGMPTVAEHALVSEEV